MQLITVFCALFKTFYICYADSVQYSFVLEFIVNYVINSCAVNEICILGLL